MRAIPNSSLLLSPLAAASVLAHAFFKEVYKLARKNGRWAMASGQPGIHTTWSTLYASTYCEMRLGFAGAAKGAEVKVDRTNRVLD